MFFWSEIPGRLGMQTIVDLNLREVVVLLIVIVVVVLLLVVLLVAAIDSTVEVLQASHLTNRATYRVVHNFRCHCFR